jgi:hypothetical protein
VSSFARIRSRQWRGTHAGRLLLVYDAMALDDHQTLLTYTATDEPARAGLTSLRELIAT